MLSIARHCCSSFPFRLFPSSFLVIILTISIITISVTSNSVNNFKEQKRQLEQKLPHVRSSLSAKRRLRTVSTIITSAITAMTGPNTTPLGRCLITVECSNRQAEMNIKRSGWKPLSHHTWSCSAQSVPAAPSVHAVVPHIRLRFNTI